MDREIKFKAWSVEHKVMLDWNKIITNKELLYSIFGNEHYATEPPRYLWKRMQFTGLYDCEGKEVYENDIVLLTHWRSNDLFNYSKPFIVKWEHGQINFKQGEYNNFIGSLIGKLEIKVIGNIFEHP